MSFMTSIGENPVPSLRDVKPTGEGHEANDLPGGEVNRIKEFLNGEPSHLFRIKNFELRTESKKNGLCNPDYEIKNPQSELGTEVYSGPSKGGLSLVSLNKVFEGAIRRGQIFVSGKIEHTNNDYTLTANSRYSAEIPATSRQSDLLKLKKDNDDHFLLSLTRDASRTELEESVKEYGQHFFLDTQQTIELKKLQRKSGDANDKNQAYLNNARHVTEELLKCESLKGEEFESIYNQIQRVNCISQEYFSQQERLLEQEMNTPPEGMSESQENGRSLTESGINTHQNETVTILTNTLNR